MNFFKHLHKYVKQNHGIKVDNVILFTNWFLVEVHLGLPSSLCFHYFTRTRLNIHDSQMARVQ